MFDNNRDAMRLFYAEVWQKHHAKKLLTALEDQVLRVILQHPEYHDMLENTDKLVSQEFHPELGESNPFMHMGLHLGLHEQISTDRPQGIAALYQSLCEQADKHEVEHQMMEVLTEMIWQAQQQNKQPDDAEYLRKLEHLAKKIKR